MKRPPRSAVLARALRIALRQARRELRRLERENVRLRNSLTEFLTEAEASDLDGDWHYYWPKPPRLCDLLARYIRGEKGWGSDLERYKRARKALGLPWWGGLDYSDGLQPGRGR